MRILYTHNIYKKIKKKKKIYIYIIYIYIHIYIYMPILGHFRLFWLAFDLFENNQNICNILSATDFICSV